MKSRSEEGWDHLQKDDKSIRILNRVVEWTSSGISYEADQRHAEIIVKQLGLEKESRSLSTPGRRVRQKDVRRS